MKKITWFCLLILLGFLLSSCTKPEKADQPAALNGIIDLRGWDFEENGSAALNGEWEFYPNKMLNPENFADRKTEDSQFKTVPSLWEKDSFATYRLKVIFDNNKEIYAVKMGEVYTSYRLWINGKEIFTSGKTGISKEQSIPQHIAHTTQFTTDSDELDIILQVSNFFYKDSGIKDPIEFGIGSWMAIQRDKAFAINFSLFGSLLIMSLYHLGLFFLRKESSSSLFFSIFCLIIASRILVTNENFIVHIFPEISWLLRTKIIVLGYYLTLPVFSTFIFKLFKRDLHKTVIRLMQVIGTAASLFVLATPLRIFVYTETVYQIIILISFLYIIVMITIAAFKKRDGAVLIIVGIICIFLTAVNDILYAQDIMTHTKGQSLVPLGIFVFILIQSYILSARFSQAFEQASIDALSQVYNRRKFLELAQIEIESAEKKDKSLSLLSIDVDHFKSVNDTYGHDAGDMVLKALADTFMESIRKFDIFGRMGGEEFALLLPDSDKDRALQISKRLHEKIRNLSIQATDRNINITVSIGIAEWKPSYQIDVLLKQADIALYKAKNNGRNRTEF